jgi:4-carboxymuconolactone decarboxylase
MAGYYNEQDLQRLPEFGKESPELMHRFMEYYNECLQDNSLSRREKVLIGLGVSHVIQCPYCIDTFTRYCHDAGVTPKEMTEAVHVGAAVTAGATISHSLQMLQILDETNQESETDAASQDGSSPTATVSTEADPLTAAAPVAANG